jgi:type II secretory pathway pseudopilin PulG
MRRIRRLFASTPGRFGRPGSRKSLLRRIGIAGFTILELAIVCEIIGFLATIVMSNYYRSKKAAQVAVTVENVRNVQTALTSYYAMMDTYPQSLNAIWLQFYNGRVIDDFDYAAGGNGGGGFAFFPSNSPDIRMQGPGVDQYAIKSKKNLIPYALYVYGDVATSAKIIR